MKKGDKVRCIKPMVEYLTDGKIYKVDRGHGEPDDVCGGSVGPDAMILCADNGLRIYALYPSCEFADWEIVK